jgi:hypothetical protein
MGGAFNRSESGVVEKEVVTSVAGQAAGMGSVKCPVESLITAAPPAQPTRASGNGAVPLSVARVRTTPVTLLCAKSALPVPVSARSRMTCFGLIQKKSSG